ncbi:RING finger protein 121 [Nematocida sp. ERTm5]|nr:RING finger protein 121 [Nematocida sp. ERTm5]
MEHEIKQQEASKQEAAGLDRQGFPDDPHTFGRRDYPMDGERDIIVVKEVIVIKVDDGSSTAVNSIIMLAIVFVGTQILASVWKKYHSKSFNVVNISTLVWFPFITGLLSKSYFFISVWLLIAFAHLVAFKDVFMGRRPKVLSTNVYNIYRAIFQCSLIISILGYLMVAVGFFKENRKLYSGGVRCLMFVLYYSLIIRIGLDIVSERASGTILPSKTAKTQGNLCPMCQQELTGKKITLGCKESFHINCIKNWKILGKKDFCPSCKERVDLSEIEMNPWQKNEYLFTKFLDFTGNLISAYAVVQGLILFM